MELASKLDQIELKLRQLSLKIERIEKENVSLLQENKTLQLKLKKEDAKVASLEQQLQKMHRIRDVNRAEAPESNQKVRKELDRYIKEIDTCIEWLSNDQQTPKGN